MPLNRLQDCISHHAALCASDYISHKAFRRRLRWLEGAIWREETVEAVRTHRDMEGFVKRLFQDSPELSTLTHSIVREKYRSHIGQEILTREEKEKLKRLVEEELMQIDDSLNIKEQKNAIQSGGQKRNLCTSDTSDNEFKSIQEQKKQRTGKEMGLSSDEQDSGIDSKKMIVDHRPRPAGGYSGAPDQEDFETEDHSDSSGSIRQSAKKKSREAGGGNASQEKKHPKSQSGRKRGRSESESDDAIEGQQSDSEEEGQRTESDIEPELTVGKPQKKRAFNKGKNNKSKERRRSKDSESGEENDQLQVKKMCAERIGDRGNKEKGGIQKEIRTRERTQKFLEESESSEVSEDTSEQRSIRKNITSNKRRRKSVKAEESESDSDNTGDSQRRKETLTIKTKRTGEGKGGFQLESNSEDDEKPKGQTEKGLTKTLRKSVSSQKLKGERGDSKKSCNPGMQKGKNQPQICVSSSDESERDSEQSKGLGHRMEESMTGSSEEEESQNEMDEEKRGKKKYLEVSVSSNESSESEKSAVGGQRKKRMITKRSKDVSDSEEEKSNGKRTAKSQKGGVGETESEDSEDSGNELEEKKKQQKKEMPQSRRKSKEMSQSGSDEEEGSSGSETNPHHSKKRHREKDREHSRKSEDHPSIQRLKRYIRECGVHKNYKKLFEGCRSRKAQVEALKMELKNIGMKGTPSLIKCRALKRKREEAAEVASLDLSNIITTEGRPRRRNVWSLYSKPQESHSSPEESPVRRPATDWSRLQGVISSDGESN